MDDDATRTGTGAPPPREAPEKVEKARAFCDGALPPARRRR